MRIGLCFDLRNPPQWRVPWYQRYGLALDRAEAAESLGIGSFWTSEHHGFEDGYLSQPLTFAAALAARTKRARIGTGIVIAPLHHPRDIAEQATIVDLISHGRLELGLGAGYIESEFQAYGLDIGRRRQVLEARVSEVRAVWDASPSEHQGGAIPIWLGVHGPKGAQMAGRLGVGLLSVNAKLFEPYRRGMEEGGHEAGSMRMAGPTHLVVNSDPERVWGQLAPHFEYQWNSYAWYAGAAGDRWRGDSPKDGGERRLEAVPSGSHGILGTSPFIDVVTPDEAVRRIQDWAGDLPVTDVYMWESIAGMPGDLVDEHIRLLAGSVAPRVATLGPLGVTTTSRLGRP